MLILDMLSHGAEAWGLRGQVWTAARVALVLHWQFGVHYHKAHVTRLLKQLQGFPQMPIERAIQRAEAAIERFRLRRWPQLKTRRDGAGLPRDSLLMQRGVEHSEA